MSSAARWPWSWARTWWWIPPREDLPAIVNRETNGQGMDVIVMAIGVPALVNSTLKLCKRGGTVNLFMRLCWNG